MIRDNILRIKEQISDTCVRLRRNPKEITIVAVSKGRSPQEIKEVISAGITDIGENRVQEALKKYYELQDISYRLPKINWHMVGHLQTNKTKDAVKTFDLIHSVDSLHLAEEINRQAAKINKIQNILVEVNTSGESSKFGLREDEVIEFIKELPRLKNLSIKGLMTIAPRVDDPSKTRPYFKALRLLRDRIYHLGLNCDLTILSMGMTEDFWVAIEEGATMIRLGRAIFEPCALG
ncbi:MAG: YggS family pyridoxal phosphate-dependent enzyme [Candidatus Omnitrophica bacterium]|nr:YggS family pyridoxal phosphate-dependent enzyme [Candidatus Omnitrophota bacterium]